ncbi:MAG: GNAT family N-acetyltransferase [Nanoarchaeota archaeon]
MKQTDIRKVSSLYSHANPFATQSEIAEWTSKYLKKYPQYNFVFIKSHKIIAAISGKIEKKKVGIINDITVLPKYQRKGIGRKLMKRILFAFTKDGIKTIQLMVFWKNARSIPFYYQFGFKLKSIGRTIKGDVIYLEKTQSHIEALTLAIKYTKPIKHTFIKLGL